jgi:translation elongation factor EF-Tu-like GTPase
MMDDEKRDQLLMEILDRLARLETKFDEQVDVKVTAREALDKSNDNKRAIEDLSKRMDSNDEKWKADRAEKWALWLTVVAGIFAMGASIVGALIG